MAFYLQAHLPEVKFASENATYLLWLDVSAYTDSAEKLAAFIRVDIGLYLSVGTVYRGNGAYFIRMNVACPLTTVEEGLRRLTQSLNHWHLQGGNAS